MKAIVLSEPGPPEALRLEDRPEPAPGAGEVLVRVRACGVCYHDVVVRSGLLRRGIRYPLVLGHELAGEVVAVGPGVARLKAGDRVAAIPSALGHYRDGGNAAYCAAPEAFLAKVPESIPFEQAAILGCPIGVVVNALRDVGGLKAGEEVVVTGAGGGVGVHAIAWARLSGARVLAVTTSPDKLERLHEAGADEVIFAPDLAFAHDVHTRTEGRGAGLVADAVGGAAFADAFASLALGGRLCFIGEVSGQEVRLNPANLLFKRAKLLGCFGATVAQLEEAARLVALGRLRPVVSEVLPLAAAAEAHRRMEERRSFGRLVLVP